MNFLNTLYMYIARGKAENPLRTKFWCQQKALITSTICCKFQTNLFEFWFYTHFFYVFPHVYSPGAGADNPRWTKFWCQQKGLVPLPICCKFKKNIFEVWFYTYFCLFLYMYTAPGQGQTTPWGQNFYFNINLLSLWSFAVSSIKWLSNSFSPYKSIRDQICPCCKIGQGQLRVIIWTNYDGPKSPMLHTKPQGHWPFGSGEEDFWRVLPYMGVVAILVMWPRPREQTFVPRPTEAPYIYEIWFW